MGNLENIQKLSVLHCIYQSIASADGAIDEVRDQNAIEYALSELNLKDGDHWARALRLNPHDAFIHLSNISDSDKVLFRKLLQCISEMGGNITFRKNCANHIIQLANCN